MKDRRVWNVKDFKLGSALGKGKFGNVYVAKTSNATVALKVMFKSCLASDAKRTLLLRREIEIHSRLVHKHILRCYGYFQDSKHIYIILQFASNGTSLSKMPFSERETKKITYQISSALEFCHSRDVIHRDLKLDNIMLVPKIEKIVLNMGVGDAVGQAKLLEGALSDMETIAGQKPVITRAKKSLASFKLREGQAIGCKVTLRGDRMYEFLDRLISLAIPRIRDFRGLPPKSFDGNGNYTFGVTEQLMFPEIDYDRVDTTRGMDITIVTTAKTNEEGKALLDAFNFPFRREGQ